MQMFTPFGEEFESLITPYPQVLRDVKMFAGVTDGIVFFRDKIPNTEDLEELLNYFDQTYVSGSHIPTSSARLSCDA